MMRTILSLLLLTVSVLGQYTWPTYVFDDQFESGDYLTFTRSSLLGTGSDVYVTNNMARSGQYSVRHVFTTAGESRRNRLEYTLSNSPNYVANQTNYVRFYIYVGTNSVIPTSKYFNVFTWSYASTVDELRVYNDAGTWKWRSSTLGLSSSAVSKETWYRVESKFFPGAGTAQLTYWINGVQILDTSSMTQTNAPTMIHLGQSGYMAPTETGTAQDIYIDDVRIDYSRIEDSDTDLRLCVPDLRGRSGVPALAIMSGLSAGDKLVWELRSSSVTNSVLTNDASGSVRARLSLRSLDSGDWTLAAVLKNSGGTVKQTRTYSWTKDYEGDPTVSIDEYNRFCVSNTPTFLFGNFVDQQDRSDSMYSSNIINIMTGGDWNDRTSTGMSNVMNKMWDLGCRTEVGFPFPDSPYPTTNYILSLVTNLASHPGIFSWFFEDEPELTAPYPVTNKIHRDWWSMVKNYDGSKIMGINLLGASYSQFIDANGKTFDKTESQRNDGIFSHTVEGKRYSWPWLVADYYGNDTYPYSYAFQQSMASFAVATKRGYTWNMGLVPSVTFIQPYSLRTGSGSAGEVYVPPTTNQVQLMLWATIAAGGSGARWFEYHVPTSQWTNNAWNNMQYCGLQVDKWESAITGVPLEDVTCDQQYWEPPDGRLSSGNGVVFSAKTYGGTNYIIAVNLSSTVTNVTFNAPWIEDGMSITPHYGSGTITANAGSFSDTIEYEGFRLYEVGGVAAPAVDGDIVSASVATNGWTLDLWIKGATTNGTFSLGFSTNDFYGTDNAKVALTITDLGFDSTGSPTTVQRTVYGTKQVRFPYPHNGYPNTTTDGTNVHVKLALSDYVYSKSSNITATFLAGLYAQGSTNSKAASGIEVTNTSIETYPQVIANNADVPYQLITNSTFTPRVVAFHHSATNGNPVQCVRFWVVDGAVSNTVVDASAEYHSEVGDAAAVVEYAPSLSASGLTDGNTVLVYWAAYPRIGDDDAVLDTRTVSWTAPSPFPCPVPYVVDAGNTYGRTFAVVATGGNDTSGAAIDAGSWNPSSPPAACATIAGAVAKIAAYNNSNHARNDAGAGVVYVRTGTHAWTGASPALGNQPASWTTIMPFPGDSGVIIGNPSGDADLNDRVRLYGLRLESTTTTMLNTCATVWLDSNEINTTSAALLYSTGIWWATRNSIANMPQGFAPNSTENNPCALARGNRGKFAIFRPLYTAIGNSNSVDMSGAAMVHLGYTGQNAPHPTNAASIMAFNNLRSYANAGSSFMTISPGMKGMAVVQNVIESRTNLTDALIKFSGDYDVVPTRNIIFWHNTLVGQRFNYLYNDTSSAAIYKSIASFVGNSCDDLNNKSDTFNHPTDGPNGGRIGNWGEVFGVGSEGNANVQISGIGTAGFGFEFEGVNSRGTEGVAITWHGYTDRKAASGAAGGAGFGDYRPTISSPLIGLEKRLVLPVDLNGVSRYVGGAIGAFEYGATVRRAFKGATLRSGTY